MLQESEEDVNDRVGGAGMKLRRGRKALYEPVGLIRVFLEAVFYEQY